jgi:hypothetical protein
VSAGFVAAWKMMNRARATARMMRIVPTYGHASFFLRTISPKANGAEKGNTSMRPIPHRFDTAEGFAIGDAMFAE